VLDPHREKLEPRRLLPLRRRDVRARNGHVELVVTSKAHVIDDRRANGMHEVTMPPIERIETPERDVDVSCSPRALVATADFETVLLGGAHCL
jgi:hypothetical protein